MSFEISTIENFDRQAKRLAKHYASFRDDYKTLLEDLRKEPMAGSDLGGGIRKVRMAIASKGKGKSGGARVITYNVKQLVGDEVLITLMTIYDKSDIDNVSDAYLRSLVDEIEGNK